MELSIKNSIYQAILQNKWLNIVYVNRADEETTYYIGIKDIDVENDRIYCDIFNPFKNSEIIKSKDIFIKISGIKSATILEHSYYDSPNTLFTKLSNDKTVSNFLEVVNFDNNILQYLSDCQRLDNDPFLKEVVMVDGIDNRTLANSKRYKLDDKQFEFILERVFKRNKHEAEIINRYQELAINKFSIDIDGKQYVVAYRTLSLNFKDKTLKVSEKSSINKSFLVSEEKRVTLGTYLDINPDDFCENYDKNEREFIEHIRDNFRNGEIMNTRPTIFFLSRNYQRGIDETYEAISDMDKSNKLSIPLKSFFGRNKNRSGTNKEVNIVVFNKSKINIDQLRVVYNSMVNHVTYVKGPPGTGKTETIFNVLLSAYANNKTVLVCSNNNHPVSDIFVKMNNSLFYSNRYRGNAEIKITFPMIRLGNNVEMTEAVNRIREIIALAKQHNRSNLKEELTENSKNKFMSSFDKLKQSLVEYEERIELRDRIATLEKIRNLTTINQISNKLDDQIKLYRQKDNASAIIKDEDILKHVISASENHDFQNYVYFSSLLKFKKILSDSYKELREMVEKDDINECITSLNKFLRDDNNLKKLLNIFPIVVCTNLSCTKLGSPKSHFDLTIMDEAGQCNLASSLIPIVRGTDLLLVGDTNQLQPVTVLEQNVNEALMKKYDIKEDYNYIHNSILSTMLKKDNNSKSILLRYHYRCGQKIADFVNQRFYNQQLKLLNNNSGELIYHNVKNSPNPNNRNSYKEEAIEIVKIIKSNGYKDVGIITPFVNQANLINEYLAKFGVDGIKAGTIHTLQGSEKSVIIMSAALSLKTSKKTMDWIKNNHELINVGVTRAKEKFIFVGDKEAIDVLSGNKQNDVRVLSDYVFRNGEVIVPKSDSVILTDFSNDSKNEKEFFETIKPYFNKKGSKFKIERNVPVKAAIKGIGLDETSCFGNKEFDVTVQIGEGFIRKQYRTIVAFEIDGGEHVGNRHTANLDRQKEEICKNHGIKLIRIANSQVKDYESIISLFEFVVKDLPNIDVAYSQISLFDEE